MAAWWVCATPGVALATTMAVRVENQSTATRCAEEDNVSVSLSGEGIRRFRVEATPPSYLAAVSADSSAPEFTGCHFDGDEHPTDPRYQFEPGTRVLHDGPQWRIVGITLHTFWRPERVPVRIDGVETRGIHLLQFFKKDKGRASEVVVMYPSDGYWRIKPLPEERFGDGVYGSSVLMGPVETARRPTVAIGSISVATAPLTLRLQFVNGGRARVDIREASRQRTVLDVAFDGTSRKTKPFAMLRSMHVAPDNADVSEVTWRRQEAAPVQKVVLPELTSIDAVDVRFGRSTPSRHNTSAPDLRFSDFR